MTDTLCIFMLHFMFLYLIYVYVNKELELEFINAAPLHCIPNALHPALRWRHTSVIASHFTDLSTVHPNHVHNKDTTDTLHNKCPVGSRTRTQLCRKCCHTMTSSMVGTLVQWLADILLTILCGILQRLGRSYIVYRRALNLLSTGYDDNCNGTLTWNEQSKRLSRKRCNDSALLSIIQERLSST